MYPPPLAAQEESMTKRAVELLRRAAEELGERTHSLLVIPKTDPRDGPHPLGLKPGSYRLEEVRHAVSLIAEMLEV
jgi:hypothetical protein